MRIARVKALPILDFTLVAFLYKLNKLIKFSFYNSGHLKIKYIAYFLSII